MRLAEDVAELGTVEQRPQQDGRNMTMLLSPVRQETEQATPVAEEQPEAAKQQPDPPKQQADAPKPQQEAAEQPSAAAEQQPEAEAS